MQQPSLWRINWSICVLKKGTNAFSALSQHTREAQPGAISGLDCESARSICAGAEQMP